MSSNFQKSPELSRESGQRFLSIFLLFSFPVVFPFFLWLPFRLLLNQNVFRENLFPFFKIMLHTGTGIPGNSGRLLKFGGTVFVKIHQTEVCQKNHHKGESKKFDTTIFIRNSLSLIHLSAKTQVSEVCENPLIFIPDP
jgi:hypothetical protein